MVSIALTVFVFSVYFILYLFLGKARRLKQAKEEAQDEIEKYRQEREKQFKEFEIKVTAKR
jgi:hypothetical protein